MRCFTYKSEYLTIQYPSNLWSSSISDKESPGYSHNFWAVLVGYQGEFHLRASLQRSAGYGVEWLNGALAGYLEVMAEYRDGESESNLGKENNESLWWEVILKYYVKSYKVNSWYAI